MMLSIGSGMYRLELYLNWTLFSSASPDFQTFRRSWNKILLIVSGIPRHDLPLVGNFPPFNDLRNALM
jgi:hypothetical protein